MGNYKLAYLIKNRSAYGDFILGGRWYHENATKNLFKTLCIWQDYIFTRSYINMFIYKVKGNIINQDVQKEDVYLPDFFSKQLGHHIGKFVFYSYQIVY